MPSLARASFTSSSLNGLMIASTFFIVSPSSRCASRAEDRTDEIGFSWVSRTQRKVRAGNMCTPDSNQRWISPISMAGADGLLAAPWCWFRACLIERRCLTTRHRPGLAWLARLLVNRDQSDSQGVESELDTVANRQLVKDVVHVR